MGLLSTRLPALFLAAVAVGTFVTACGERGTAPLQSDPRSLVEEVGARTRAAGSAAFDVTYTYRRHTGTDGAHVDGEYDFARQVGRMTVDIPGGPESAQYEMLLFGPWIYWRSIPTKSEYWSRARPGWIGSPFEDTGGTDLTAILDLLADSTEDVRDEGRDEIDGESTRNLELSVGVGRLLDRVRGQEGYFSGGALVDVFTGPVPVDMWIDDEGRLRRLSFEVAISWGEERPVMGFSMDLRDFGTDVEVLEPSPDDVGGDFGIFGSE